MIVSALVSPVLKTSPAMAGATFTVNSTADDADSYLPDGICDTKNYPLSDPPVPPSGICTLRAAIQQANYNMDSDVINFNIPGLGFHTITPQTFLPNITAPLSIWGGSQPGYAGQPLIELNGTLVSANNPGATGLVIFAPDSAVGGMVINSFGGVGILLMSGSNKVYASYIGTDVTGTLPRGNGLDGVRIIDSTNNEIGGAVGPNGFPSNVISGNGESGIRIDGQGATGNKVFGNYIGTSANGKEKIPNGWDGVHIHNAPFNFIGMDVNNTRNVISGNTQNGVRIMVSGSTGNMVRGNYIGTDVNGLDPLGNTQNGVHIVAGASNNTVGGTSLDAERNIISGNGQNGILVTAEPFMEYMGKPTGNIIKGNRIGTNAVGDGAVFNGEDGVHIYGASSNIIGVPEFGAGNTISGNTFSGIHITGSDAQTNVVQNNLIGTNSAGSAAIANLDGVSISQGASGNTIGGTGLFMANTIAGNAKNGIKIYKLPIIGTAPTNNYVYGNNIGVNNNGNKVANKDYGIMIESSPTNFIGGAGIGAGNTISGNGVDGILIKGSGATGNVVQRNLIGTNSFNVKLGNGGNGVAIENVPDNLIGGTAADVGNIISDNAFSGVHISGSGATGNLVQGNKIGTNNGGTAPLGNFLGGVSVTTGASNNTIGGIEPEAGNTISGNKNGVHIYKLILGEAPAGNKVQGNHIGTNSANATGLGNTEHGVFIDSSPANFIGGTVSLAQNTISGNTRDGIHIQGAGATGNLVQGNRIGTNTTGDAKLGNLEYGLSIDGAPDNIIGGTEDSARNIIAGNGFSGVYIAGSGATGNLVKGNYIGANAAGTGALGNTLDGVSITSEASNNTIGGPTFISRNIISGNGKNGIKIHKPLLLSGAPASNKVLNNYIGTDKDGSAKLGNTENGVLIESSATNIIGGDDGISRNIISGNVQHGVMITGSGANGNLVQSNYIGTNGSSATNLGNTKSGVYIGGGSNNIIGGTIAFARNVISSNGENGVAIVKAPAAESAPTGNNVTGNYIGTDLTGMVAVGNTFDGVKISNAPANTIGGVGAGVRNVISGNTNNGVVIEGSGATANTVQGNYIGVKQTGDAALANGFHGVSILGAANNTIGGTIDGVRNIISGNTMSGVKLLWPGATGNKVQGNYIGTNASGTAKIANVEKGVLIDGAPGNTIGGAIEQARNIISGNGQHGISIENAGATGNLVQGNYIGIKANGNEALGNTLDGVLVENASANTIGGTQAWERNIISGQCLPIINGICTGQNGITISGSGATGNIVQGNYIGTSADGTVSIYNPLRNREGVFINGGANNVIGGAVEGARNIIAANAQNGIKISGATATGNQVLGNYIGISLDTDDALGGNALAGVLIDNAPNNTVGGTQDAARNIISLNAQHGIKIFGSGATGNQVLGNYIGTKPDGNTGFPGPGPLGITSYGVLIQEASNNTIGGVVAKARNVISSNLNSGVGILGPGASGNKIQGNYIGTNSNGSAKLGNWGVGVYINAPNNTIGGPEASAGNIISGNHGDGVVISGSSATGNKVQGNLIGPDSAGTANLGNVSSGVKIDDGASNNTVGGMSGEVAAGNTIAFNMQSGVSVFAQVGSSPAVSNEVSRNSIFSNDYLGIDIGVVGVTSNDVGDADTGANHQQNFPVLASATKTDAATLAIQGSFNSEPSRSYNIEFFSNPAVDPSGYGEGKTYLDKLPVSTDASGNVSFDTTLQTGTVGVGQHITATATDVGRHETSEFSQAIQVTAPPVPFQVYWTDYTPSPIRPGEAVTVPLTIQNTGTLTWPKGGSNPVYVSYHWVDTANGQMVIWDGQRTSLPADVAKDESITLNASLKAPTTPGTYTLKWDMVQEGAAWFSANGAATLDKSITVAATKTLDVQWVSHTTPPSIKPGQQLTVPLTITNIGSQTWTKNPVYVSYHWFNASTGAVVAWDGLRSVLPNNVAPGESVSISATLKAPSAAGNYTLKWDMIEEGVAWFSLGGAPTLDVAVSVAAMQAKDLQWAPHNTPTSIKPGQMVGIPITLTNTGSQT